VSGRAHASFAAPDCNCNLCSVLVTSFVQNSSA
jgi:hypothetical protein